MSAFHSGGVCAGATHDVAFTTGAATIDKATTCDCRGHSRSVLPMAAITSYRIQGSIKGCSSCCGFAAVDLRTMKGIEAESTLKFADHKAIAEAGRLAAAAAKKDPAALTANEFHKGVRCSAKTCLGCRAIAATWRVGPTADVAFESEDSHCVFHPCDQEVGHAWTRLEHVKATEAYRPLGSCACFSGPSGACTCNESVGLLLADGDAFFGPTGLKESGALVDALHAGKRASGARYHLQHQETEVQVIKGSAGCCSRESKLTITSERVILSEPTQGPIAAALTCGLCQGSKETGIWIEDVSLVSAAVGGPCHTLGAPLRQPCTSLGRSVKSLRCTLFSLLVLAAFVALTVVGILVGASGNVAPFVFSAIGVGCLLFFLHPGLVFVPVNLARCAAAVVLSLAHAACCCGCFCLRRRAAVVMSGPVNLSLSVQPVLDVGQADANGVAAQLGAVVTHLQHQRRVMLGEASHAGVGAAKASPAPAAGVAWVPPQPPQPTALAIATAAPVYGVPVALPFVGAGTQVNGYAGAGQQHSQQQLMYSDVRAPLMAGSAASYANAGY